ncbi:GNAT family N-acetyltransferase [Jannaschia sp. 2305UL9-9]|uniref:GNAT family N-acetyltransferase n=1 Tax=Jannaschia sp. 2305UL9-9 TaxID=3121638 RepID=UPI0035289FB4
MSLSADLAALHATAFDGASRWSEGAFEAALTDPRCFFSLHETQGRLTGFALGRVIADEAELLTLVVAIGDRRTGTGRHLVQAFEMAAAERGAQTVFLEVSAENAPARRLYERAGWRTVGQRSGYYEGVDALTMRKDL